MTAKAAEPIIEIARHFKVTSLIIYAPELPKAHPEFIKALKEAGLKGVWRRRDNWETANR